MSVSFTDFFAVEINPPVRIVKKAERHDNKLMTLDSVTRAKPQLTVCRAGVQRGCRFLSSVLLAPVLGNYSSLAAL